MLPKWGRRLAGPSLHAGLPPLQPCGRTRPFPPAHPQFLPSLTQDSAPWCLGPAVGEQAAGQVCSLRLPSAPHITPPTPPLGGQVSQADTRNSGYQESLFMLLSQACREPHCPSPLTSLCCRDDLAAWMKSGRSGVHLQWALLASYCFL